MILDFLIPTVDSHHCITSPLFWFCPWAAVWSTGWPAADPAAYDTCSTDQPTNELHWCPQVIPCRKRSKQRVLKSKIQKTVSTMEWAVIIMSMCKASTSLGHLVTSTPVENMSAAAKGEVDQWGRNNTKKLLSYRATQEWFHWARVWIEQVSEWAHRWHCISSIVHTVPSSRTTNIGPFLYSFHTHF